MSRRVARKSRSLDFLSGTEIARIPKGIVEAVFLLDKNREAAFARNQFAVMLLLRAWIILRSIDINHSGQGWIEIALVNRIFDVAGIRLNVLKQHPLFRVFFAVNRSAVMYRSAESVAANLAVLLGVEKVDYLHNIAEVDLRFLLRGRLARFKSVLYGIVVDGQTISRDNIEKWLGVSKSQQRRYEKEFGIVVRKNIVNVPFNDEEHLQEILSLVPHVDMNDENHALARIDRNRNVVTYQTVNSYFVDRSAVRWVRKRRVEVLYQVTRAKRYDGAVFFNEHGLNKRDVSHGWICGRTALLYAGTSPDGSGQWILSPDTPSRSREAVRYGGIPRALFVDVARAIHAV